MKHYTNKANLTVCVNSEGKILLALSERGKSTENKPWFAPRGLAKWTQSLDCKTKIWGWGESERDKGRRQEHDREEKRKGRKRERGWR